MKRDSSIYLQDILENLDKAKKFLGRSSLEKFKEDEKTYYAVVRCIEVIGEATKNLPDEVKKQYPDIPWKEISGMRDKAIHSYFGLMPDRIWRVVKEDMPILKPVIKKALKELKK